MSYENLPLLPNLHPCCNSLRKGDEVRFRCNDLNQTIDGKFEGWGGEGAYRSLVISPLTPATDEDEGGDALGTCDTVLTIAKSRGRIRNV